MLCMHRWLWLPVPFTPLSDHPDFSSRKRRAIDLIDGAFDFVSSTQHKGEFHPKKKIERLYILADLKVEGQNVYFAKKKTETLYNRQKHRMMMMM